MRRLLALLAVAVVFLVARRASAIEEKCSGPDACCPDEQVESPRRHVHPLAPHPLDAA